VLVEKHFSPRELSELADIPTTTLSQWRFRSKSHPHAPAHGPRFVKLGRLVRYPASAVSAWLSQREHVATPTK
jgi:predicted DNA-binding transcriptional regulator AlpA